jgi:hypothetical protein
MSAAHEVAARVAACRTKAEALLAEINALAAELPESPDDADEGAQESVLSGVRAELEVAAEQIEGALDYLTPRSDDEDPGCCAHRRLQAAIAAQGDAL